MCTSYKCVSVKDCIFCAEQEDGTDAYGCSFCGNNCLCCTKNKPLALTSSELEAYDVVIPPVENIKYRSACCCFYFGFACKAEDKPCGITTENSCLCCQDQCGAQLTTAETTKRACCSDNMKIHGCSCEEMASSEFIMHECSDRCMLLCCFDCGAQVKWSCCPTPITLYGSQGQCCCLMTRCSFPCNNTTPCELGCCGHMCINKLETIAEFEQIERQKKDSLEALDAVIVEKKGASPRKRTMTADDVAPGSPQKMVR